MRTLYWSLQTLLIIPLVADFAWGAPAGLTFQGRLVKDGVAVEREVDVTIKVTSIAIPTVRPECVLFEETHHLDLTGSDGIMTLKIGSGTRTANDEGLSLAQVFSNTGVAVSGLSCSGAPGSTSYTSQSTDSRNVYVSFVDGTETIAFASPYVIQSVPYAIEAERLAGKTASEYLQVTTNTTQTKLNDLMETAAYDELLDLIAGNSGQYLRPSASNFTPTATVDFNGQNIANSTGISLSGAADRSIAMARQATSDTAGNQLTIAASGAASGATDKAGGALVLSSGVSTGSGSSAIEFKTSAGGGSGTVDRAPATKMTILGNGNVGIGTAGPNAKLHVSTSTTDGLRVSMGNYDSANAALYVDELPLSTGTLNGKALSVHVNGETFARGMLFSDGSYGIGAGATTRDVFIRRNAANSLLIDSDKAGGAAKLVVTGKLGIQVPSPSFPLDVQASDAGPTIYGHNTGTGNGVTGSATNILGVGVYGVNSTSGYGVKGQGGGVGGVGVYGIGNLYGIQGSTASGSGAGLFGTNTSGANTGYGVVAVNNSATGWSFYASGTSPSFFQGQVGIGTTPTEKLHVAGNLRVQGTTDCTLGNGASGTSCSSDIRLKENVRPIKNALAKILRLNGVEFDWNQRSLSYGRHDIGVIAQQVEKVFPTTVSEEPTTGFKKVDYAALVSPLIQSTKELYRMCRSSNEQVTEVQDEVASLKSENAAIRLENARISSEAAELSRQNADLQRRLEQIEKRLGLQ